MTAEEAKCPCDGCQNSYCYKNCKAYDAWKERVDEALAKQIAKPVTEMVEDGAFICQSCHSSVPYWASYCPECGQRLERKEKWFIRLLKRIGIIREYTIDKTEMCKAAQNICGHQCEQCAWRTDKND